MPNATGKSSDWSVLGIVAAWLIAAICLALCAAALALWQIDLSIRKQLPEMGYNDILALRGDTWLPFRVPLAGALAIISVGLAALDCIPALLVKKPVACVPAAIAIVAAEGTLGYLMMTR